MSALPPKADIDRRLGNVRFVPIADIGNSSAQQKDRLAAVSPTSEMFLTRRQRSPQLSAFFASSAVLSLRCRKQRAVKRRGEAVRESRGLYWPRGSSGSQSDFPPR